MKALLLNTLLGLGLGRFGSIWVTMVFVPIVAGEVAYGVYTFHLSAGACLRRGVTLLICAQLAFLLGALMRPMRNET
jgi:ABC-type spermidine/putrescine transport system permease subunit II